MIGYGANHTLKPETDAGRAFRTIQRFLATCTDCRGPRRYEGLPSQYERAFHRPDWENLDLPSCLEEMAVLIEELVRDKRPCGPDLSFSFRLVDPVTSVVLPYPDPALAERDGGWWMSKLSVELRNLSETKYKIQLVWPWDEPNETFERSRDAIFAALGTTPKDKWGHIAMRPH